MLSDKVQKKPDEHCIHWRLSNLRKIYAAAVMHGITTSATTLEQQLQPDQEPDVDLVAFAPTSATAIASEPASVSTTALASVLGDTVGTFSKQIVDIRRIEQSISSALTAYENYVINETIMPALFAQLRQEHDNAQLFDSLNVEKAISYQLDLFRKQLFHFGEILRANAYISKHGGDTSPKVLNMIKNINALLSEIKKFIAPIELTAAAFAASDANGDLVIPGLVRAIEDCMRTASKLCQRATNPSTKTASASSSVEMDVQANDAVNIVTEEMVNEIFLNLFPKLKQLTFHIKSNNAMIVATLMGSYMAKIAELNGKQAIPDSIEYRGGIFLYRRGNSADNEVQDDELSGELEEFFASEVDGINEALRIRRNCSAGGRNELFDMENPNRQKQEDASAQQRRQQTSNNKGKGSRHDQHRSGGNGGGGNGGHGRHADPVARAATAERTPASRHQQRPRPQYRQQKEEVVHFTPHFQSSISIGKCMVSIVDAIGAAISQLKPEVRRNPKILATCAEFGEIKTIYSRLNELLGKKVTSAESNEVLRIAKELAARVILLVLPRDTNDSVTVASVRPVFMTPELYEIVNYLPDEYKEPNGAEVTRFHPQVILEQILYICFNGRTLEQSQHQHPSIFESWADLSSSDDLYGGAKQLLVFLSDIRIPGADEFEYASVAKRLSMKMSERSQTCLLHLFFNKMQELLSKQENNSKAEPYSITAYDRLLIALVERLCTGKVFLEMLQIDESIKNCIARYAGFGNDKPKRKDNSNTKRGVKFLMPSLTKLSAAVKDMLTSKPKSSMADDENGILNFLQQQHLVSTIPVSSVPAVETPLSLTAGVTSSKASPNTTATIVRRVATSDSGKKKPNTNLETLLTAMINGDTNAFEKFLKEDNHGTNLIDMVSIAADNGYASIIKAFHQAGINVNEISSSGFLPIFLAAQNGHENAIIALCAAGANVNALGSQGITAVWIAAQNGHVKAIEELCKAGANVDMPDSQGSTPMLIAAQYGRAEVIVALHRAGANVNKSASDGAAPLWVAAQKGHVKAIEELCRAGADVEQLGPQGATAVWIAAQNGHPKAIEALHKAGANVNVARNNGETAVCAAARSNKAGTVELLCKLGAEAPNLQEGCPLSIVHDWNSYSAPRESTLRQSETTLPEETPGIIQPPVAMDRGKLLIDVTRNNIDGVNRFLAEVHNAKDICNQMNAIHIAAQNGHVEIVEALLKVGVDGNKAASNLQTPIWFAASCGHANVIEELRKHGAAVDQQNSTGVTPVWIAASNGHAKAINALCRPNVYGSCADVNIPDHDGMTPLHIAVINAYKEVINALCLFGARVNSRNNNGETSVFVAARYGNASMIWLLYQCGADVDIPNNTGGTPLKVAVSLKHSDAQTALNMIKKRVEKEMLTHTQTGATIATTSPPESIQPQQQPPQLPQHALPQPQPQPPSPQPSPQKTRPR